MFSHHFSSYVWFLQSKPKNCYDSIFQFLMQFCRVKYIKQLWIRKYSLEHKCEWNMSVLWLFLEIVIFCLNFLDRVVLAHPYGNISSLFFCPMLYMLGSHHVNRGKIHKSLRGLCWSNMVKSRSLYLWRWDLFILLCSATLWWSSVVLGVSTMPCGLGVRLAWLPLGCGMCAS